jgi:hypothetical protein
MSLLNNAIDYFHKLDGSFNLQKSFKLQSLQILLDIRSINNACELKYRILDTCFIDSLQQHFFVFRVFQGSLQEAERLSRSIDRPVAVLVEEDPEDSIAPSIETLALRAALADPALSSLLNQKVLHCLLGIAIAIVPMV